MERMELYKTAFRRGNSRYANKVVAIDSNCLSAKEKCFLEGLALIMNTYDLCEEVILAGMKQTKQEVLDSMENHPEYWNNVCKESGDREDRVAHYKELIAEITQLIALLGKRK